MPMRQAQAVGRRATARAGVHFLSSRHGSRRRRRHRRRLYRFVLVG